ncbi:hypothetical protein ACGK9R_13950 [Halomonas sp. HNIBRBA4712]|uniref:hypothetical protein n=1 Tax=Halomonas sp. HNIBRBA4712 TaxID=3373087 RepID=UPI003746A3F9
MQRTFAAHNQQPNPDFCGLSPEQMTNWLYAPWQELQGVTINTPDTLSSSPVMRYLALMLDEAEHHGGAFKATPRGNLPAKLVKQASALLPEFAVARYAGHISISDFAGHNEESINALHYTRVLAEVAGILYRRKGHFHVKKSARKQYQTQGLQAFFIPMLEAATQRYNWGYFDGWEESVDLASVWLFMLWRLHTHTRVDTLTDEVITTFPALLAHLPTYSYTTPTKQLGHMIESRFIERFLQFWGFVIIDPLRVSNGEPIKRKAEIQPLFEATFTFHV